jgi:hypothetical protein
MPEKSTARFAMGTARFAKGIGVGGTACHMPEPSTARFAMDIGGVGTACHMPVESRRALLVASTGGGTLGHLPKESRVELPGRTARAATEIESPGKSVRCRSQDDAGVSAMGPAKRMRMDPFSEDFVAADPMEQVPPEWHSPSVLVNGKSLMSPKMLANRVLPAEM